MKITIDFETRSKADIKTCGAWAYSEDPSTTVLCMAWAVNDEPVQLWTPETPGEINRALSLIVRGSPILVEAHNAFFERCIWNNIMVPRFNWPRISHEQWRCSASKTAARALPRALGTAGKALGLSEAKDDQGKRIMLKLARPRTPTKNDPGEWNEDPLEYGELYDYCRQDVNAERALSLAVRDLNPLELKIWQLDQKINERGICVDQAGARAALFLIAQQTQKLLAEARRVSGGAVDNVSQRDKVLAWIKSRGVDLSTYTKQDIVDALKIKTLPPDVRRILEIRQQLGKTSTAKYETMLDACGSDGRIHDMFLYHGATTGRWTGKLVQLQNMPRGTVKDTDACVDVIKRRDLELLEMLYDNVMEAISSCIRGMLVAAPGHDLIAADFAAIEARVLFWLAGETRGLNMFRNSEDLYVDLAKDIYPGQTIDKLKRELGKRGILGCGYGMGKDKFQGTCKQHADIEISIDFADHVVRTYREKFPSVPKLWWAQEEAAVKAVQTKKIVQCGKVSWGMVADVLYCRLPSGRCLAYNSPRLKITETPWGAEKWQLSFMTTVKGMWVRETTYGGKVVENITQAVARDLLAEAMLRVEAVGYPIVLHVHDELAAEIPENFGSVKEFENLMAQLPAWAAGCPVKAEGWRGKRYKK